MRSSSAHADTDHPPDEQRAPADLDVSAITETIRQTYAPRLALPSEDCIAVLVGRLRGHVAVLLGRDLGPDDERRQTLIRQAEALLTAHLQDGTRFQQWEHARVLALMCRDLMRLYEIHRSR